VPLIVPATTLARVKFLADIADSFIYIVSRMGITGSSEQVAINSTLPDVIARVREHTAVPLAVGFGVSSREQFDYVDSAGADAVVVGSKIISVVHAAPANEVAQQVKDYCLTLTSATGKAQLPKLKGNPSSTYGGNQKAQGGGLDKNLLPSRFGDFGGQYVPEAIVGALIELEEAHHAAMKDPAFLEEFRSYYGYMGRPSNLYLAERLTADVGGARIWLKREDL